MFTGYRQEEEGARRREGALIYTLIYRELARARDIHRERRDIHREKGDIHTHRERERERDREVFTERGERERR